MVLLWEVEWENIRRGCKEKENGAVGRNTMHLLESTYIAPSHFHSKVLEAKDIGSGLSPLPVFNSHSSSFLGDLGVI